MSTPSFCPNCYHPNPGEYCPQCGQKQIERRMSVRALVVDFVDEQFGVNRRLPKTLKPLFFKPGFLTTEYFNGRVQQYIAPLRLYLLTSVVFFALFILSNSSTVTIDSASDRAREGISADTAAERVLRARAGRQRGTIIDINLENSDTTNWLEDVNVNLGYEPLSNAAERKLRDYSRFGQVEGTRRLLRSVFAHMPKVVFAMLPLYAVLLWLFFRRQRKYYIEHLIMALHLHAFGFLALLPGPLFDMAFLPEWMNGIGDVLSTISLLWIIVYIFLALRRVYGQGRLITALKYFLLWILYTINLGVGIVISGLLALTTG